MLPSLVVVVGRVNAKSALSTCELRQETTGTYQNGLLSDVTGAGIRHLKSHRIPPATVEQPG